MGSLVSAVVANLYFDFFFEEMALEPSPSRPRLWKRMTHAASLGKVTWMGYYISIYSPWRWREGGSLPFLETKITRKEDGLLDITV